MRIAPQPKLWPISAAIRIASLILLLPQARALDGYVGSKVCYGCHQDIYKTFVKTAMGQSMRPASDLDRFGVPTEAVVPAVVPSEVLRVSKAADGWRQSEELLPLFKDEHLLAYIVGSGNNGLTFVVRRGSGLFQAPLSYYVKPAKWDLSPGYENLDIGFARPIAQQCIACHSGRATPVAGRTGDFNDPPFQELAIGCENCHGPGNAHAKNPHIKAAIVNPAKLEPRRAEDICMNCHQGGDARILQPGKGLLDFRPGEALIDTVAIFKTPPDPQHKDEADLLEHNSAMKSSRCFIASQGKLSCLTCHNPHVQPSSLEAGAYFRQKCFTCHSDKSCTLPLAQRAQSADNCVGCHMPKRDVALISHSALTNHRIPARPGEATVATPWQDDRYGALLVDSNQAHPPVLPNVTLLRVYSELSEKSEHYSSLYLSLLDKMAAMDPKEPLVQAGLGHRALASGDNAAALEHLNQALPLHEANVYLDRAKALSNLGRDPEALGALQQAAALEPYDFTIAKMTILEEIKLKDYSKARELMQKYVDFLPEDAFMRDLLARVSH